MTEEKTPFINVGIGKLAKTGRSVRFEYYDQSSVFMKVFYCSRDAMTQLLNGRRREITLYQLAEEQK